MKDFQKNWIFFFTGLKNSMFQLLCIFLCICSANLTAELSQKDAAVLHVETILKRYKTYLDKGTYEGRSWDHLKQKPGSRFVTLRRALTHFVRHKGKIVVETGTSRSFVKDGLSGYLKDDPRYWDSAKPEIWDWKAGIFTKVAAECFYPMNVQIHTVDISNRHIERCKVMTREYQNVLHYHVASSVDFLKTCNLVNKIDLLYLDAGEMTEEGAQLQLQEVQTLVQRKLLSKEGLILIDDVQIPDDPSSYGKAKYSIPYLLDHDFEILMNEYQVLLKKK